MLPTSISEEIKILGKLCNETEEEILSKALKIGLDHIFQEELSYQLIKGTIEREEAIKYLGEEQVVLLERQKKMVDEDLIWGTTK